MKKILSLLMASVLLLAPAFSLANAQTNSTSTDDTVLYSAEEITDVDALIQRSLAGINDLQENTGFEFTISSSTETPLAFSAYSANVQSGEIYVTSQLLRSELVNGEQIDTYAVKAVRAILPYNTSETAGALVSTMYINYDEGKSSIILVRTVAMIRAAGATRLVMTNGYQEAPQNDRITTSSSYANPGAGTYNLYPNSSVWVSDNGTLYLRNSLYYGSSLYKTEFIMNRYLQTFKVNY